MANLTNNKKTKAVAEKATSTELAVSIFVLVCAMVAASLSLGTYIGYLSVLFSQQQL